MTANKKGGNIFIKFLFSGFFLKNLAVAVILIAIFIYAAIKFLDIYTDHGKEIILPQFTGMTLQEIDSIGYNKRFDFFVIDSVYDETKKGGSVIMQLPHTGEKVKKGRNVYLTIVAMSPEKVIMPDLVNLTVRQAINVLESSKLKPGKLEYVPSFDKNAVLSQFFEGDTVFPGDTLVKGSVIDLTVGSGDRVYEIPVPFLIGKSREEAIFLMNSASFNLGHEIYLDSVRDEHAKVFMQSPRWDDDIPAYPGDSIHLWYRSDDSINFDLYLQIFLPDSLWTDSIAVDSMRRRIDTLYKI